MVIKKDDQRDRLRDILLGPKKHRELGLAELREAGKIIYQNAEQIGLYGFSPSDLVARG